MNGASQPKSESQGWIEDIRRAGETAREKERLRDARLDKIISELDSCNIVWYLDYSTGHDIANMILTRPVGDTVEVKAHDNFILQRKRAIVEQYIIPAMHACIRAGFLKPSDEQ